MKKSIALAAATIMLAAPVFAQGFDPGSLASRALGSTMTTTGSNTSALGSMMGGGGSSSLTSMAQSQVMAMLQKSGYTNIGALTPSPMAPNLLQTTATDKSGNPVNLMIDPIKSRITGITGP